MSLLNPYTIDVDNKIFDDIYKRISLYPWDSLISVDGWDYGTDPTYMKELCEYWTSDLDWKKHENIGYMILIGVNKNQR